MPTSSSDGHVKTAAVLYETEIAGSYATQDDNVALRPLESVHCRNLDGFQGLVFGIND